MRNQSSAGVTDLTQAVGRTGGQAVGTIVLPSSTLAADDHALVLVGVALALGGSTLAVIDNGRSGGR